MKTESSFVDEKKKEAINLRERDKVIRKKCCRRPIKNRIPKMMPTTTTWTTAVVQKLFDTCRHVFKGPGTVPPPRDVQCLERILDKMKPEDVGLSKDLLFFRPDTLPKGPPTITYSTIYKSENFSMCIFFLPPKAVIPLHNHPGMTVFSKLLLGSMHIKAYDWVDPSKSDDTVSSPKRSQAKLVVDTEFTAPCNTSILYPSAGGNIHAFTAITACAVLDVLGPPYSIEDDRDCTYYKDYPYSTFSDGGAELEDVECTRGWLEAIEMPKDLRMEGVEYLGPQVGED